VPPLPVPAAAEGAVVLPRPAAAGGPPGLAAAVPLAAALAPVVAKT